MHLGPNLRDVLTAESARYKAGPPFEKTEPKKVMVEKPQLGLRRHPNRDLLEKSTTFLHVTEKSCSYCRVRVMIAINIPRSDAGLPGRVFIVAINVRLESLKVAMNQRITKRANPAVDQQPLVNFHV